jgi:hypothetical protein
VWKVSCGVWGVEGVAFIGTHLLPHLHTLTAFLLPGAVIPIFLQWHP